MSEKGVQVIDRVFDILELLSTEANGIGVTEISYRLDLNKSTVHRILSALVARGYAEKTPGSTNYKIGLKFIDLGSTVLNGIELKAEAKPYLDALVKRFNQPVHLGVLDDFDVVYIDKVDTNNTLRIYSQIGKRIPCHCSALGKSLLSGLSTKDLKKYLKGYIYTQFTETTVKNKAEFINEINLVNIQGFSVDNMEYESHIRCISAPIWDYRKQVIAAISITANKDIFTPDRDSEIGIHVADIAHQISIRMGYRDV